MGPGVGPNQYFPPCMAWNCVATILGEHFYCPFQHSWSKWLRSLTLKDPLPDSFVPHNIKIDRWAEILCDSNCCVQVDDHMPPSTRDKNCFTRAVQDLKLKKKANQYNTNNHSQNQKNKPIGSGLFLFIHEPGEGGSLCSSPSSPYIFIYTLFKGGLSFSEAGGVVEDKRGTYFCICLFSNQL